MTEDRLQLLLDTLESQERRILALEGAGLANALFIQGVMTVLSERGVVRPDDMAVVLAGHLAVAEQSGTDRIGKAAAQHLKLLLNMSLLTPPADKPTAQ